MTTQSKVTATPNWREQLPVHPAADVFPLLSKAELRELAEDIKRNGLQKGVVLYTDPAREEDVTRLLDGRNRLDALELLGDKIFDQRGRVRKEWYEKTVANGYDPAAYVISANIKRRHLTKRQQAALIVAAVEAGNTDRAKVARSVNRDPNGRVRGSTKDPIKEQVVALAAEHGISERTARQALVDAEPERKRTRPQPRKQAVPDLQEALAPVLAAMAAKLAATGHGAVTIKTVATFADGTQIKTVTRHE